MTTTAPAAATPVAHTAVTAAPVAPTTPASATLEWGAGALAALGTLNKLTDTVALQAYNTLVPAVVRMFVSGTLITNAIDNAFGLVENAVKGQSLTIPTASDVIRQAMAYLNKVEPSFLAFLIAPAEDLIIAGLVRLGALPASSSRQSLGL